MKKRTTQPTVYKKDFFNLALYQNHDLKNLLQQCNALYQSIYVDKLKIDDCQTLQSCINAERIFRERQEKLNALLQLLSEHCKLLERCRDVEQELKIHALSMKKFTLNIERAFDIINPPIVSLSFLLTLQGTLMILVGSIAYPIFFTPGVVAVTIGVVLTAITATQLYQGKKEGEKIYRESKEKHGNVLNNTPLFQSEIDVTLLRIDREPLPKIYSENSSLFFNPKAREDKTETIDLSNKPENNLMG